MGSLTSVAVAAIVGVTLAVLTTFGVVTVSQQTPENTKPVEQPLVVYGER
jgi:hypothetical protein